MMKFLKKGGTVHHPFFKNHDTGKMMEDGCIPNICFLSFKERFHFHDYGRKRYNSLLEVMTSTVSLWHQNFYSGNQPTKPPFFLHAESTWLTLYGELFAISDDDRDHFK